MRHYLPMANSSHSTMSLALIIQPLTRSLTHSLSSLTHSLTHSHHSLTHLLTHSLTLITHSLIQATESGCAVLPFMEFPLLVKPHTTHTKPSTLHSGPWTLNTLNPKPEHPEP